MKIVELFSGIGAQTQALKNLGIDHVSTCCEWDDTIHSIYEAIHGKTPNLGDITKVESLPDCDLLTYSFPCQDLSILGNQKGLGKGSGTRSGLLWEIERLLRNKKNLPKILLLENVKQLVSPKNINDFNAWLEFLTSIGYSHDWKVINSADYGVPQGRERVFVLSVLSSEPIKLPDIKKECPPLKAFMANSKEVIKEYGDIHFFKNAEMRERIYKTINNTQSTNSTKRIYGTHSIVHALTTQGSHPGNFGAILYSQELKEDTPFRAIVKGMPIEEIYNTDLGFDVDSIRLATPREVFRLMGFSETAFEDARDYMLENNISINKSYHVAGNSIVVPVLEEIFKQAYAF
jgi:DNA (cytosine-5)-methyltransferase 1